MKMRRGSNLLTVALFLLLLIVAAGFPIYSLSSEGTVKPGHAIIEKTIAQPCTVISDCKDHIEALSIDALSSFYDTIIIVLLAVLAVVAGLAILSLRLISHAAAEDIARDVVHGVIKDSKDFNERITNAVSDEFQDVLSGINTRLQNIEIALKLKADSQHEINAEDVTEQQVVQDRTPEDR